MPVAADGLREGRRCHAVGPPQLRQHALADLGCCAVSRHECLPQGTCACICACFASSQQASTLGVHSAWQEEQEHRYLTDGVLCFRVIGRNIC